ncbi:hypothetical protein LTS18_013270, partial [Coniosporium uncinatum]
MPTTRSPRPQAQTLRQAKASHRKSTGIAISTLERKRIERGAELDTRAEKAREQERRRKSAQKKKAEREEKERVKRKQLGIGLATQLVGFRHTQRRMKRAMEGWVRKVAVQAVVEEDEDASGEDEVQVDEGLDGTHKQHLTEPWEEEHVDDETLLDTLVGEAKAQLEPGPNEDQAVPDFIIDSTYLRTPTRNYGSQSEPPKRSSSQDLDLWSDLLVSNTQIAMELTPKRSTPKRGTPAHTGNSLSAFGLCTQDLDFLDDVDESADINKPVAWSPSACKTRGSAHAERD